MMRDPSWQNKANNGFASSDFSIDWKNKRATCPRGKQSDHWRQARSADYEMDVVYFEFFKSDNSVCSVRADCTSSTTQRRRLTVNARLFYEAMQANRKRQETADFKQEYKQRADMESTISQGVRAFEMRETLLSWVAENALAAHFAAAMNAARLKA